MSSSYYEQQGLRDLLQFHGTIPVTIPMKHQLSLLIRHMGYYEPNALATILWLHGKPMERSTELIQYGLLLWTLTNKDNNVLLQMHVQELKHIALPEIWRQVAHIFMEAYIARTFDYTSLTVNQFMYITGASIYAVHKMLVERNLNSPYSLADIAKVCAPTNNLVDTGIITAFRKFPLLDPLIRREARQMALKRKRIREDLLSSEKH